MWSQYIKHQCNYCLPCIQPSKLNTIKRNAIINTISLYSTIIYIFSENNVLNWSTGIGICSYDNVQRVEGFLWRKRLWWSQFIGTCRRFLTPHTLTIIPLHLPHFSIGTFLTFCFQEPFLGMNLHKRYTLQRLSAFHIFSEVHRPKQDGPSSENVVNLHTTNVSCIMIQKLLWIWTAPLKNCPKTKEASPTNQFSNWIKS